MIHVEAGWDPAEGRIALKSRVGRRRVPIPAVLRDHLLDQRATVEREGAELIFGSTPESPFTANRIQARADTAWEEAGLERITPHECRHTFASLMIAAGVNAKALSTFMGHATISVTLDRYGHLMPAGRPRRQSCSTGTSMLSGNGPKIERDRPPRGTLVGQRCRIQAPQRRPRAPSFTA